MKTIKNLALLIGIAILGGFAFEAILGIAPSLIQAFALMALIAIGIWLSENA